MTESMEGDTVLLQREVGTSCLIHVFGATLTSWKCNNEEFIFLSSKSKFDHKTAIRGGIPIVFPNFGPWTLGPQHGFARTSRWEVAQPPNKDINGDVSAILTLTDDEHTRSMWNFKFKLTYKVVLGSSSLCTSLTVDNTGDADFDFTCLLHTYFRVPDVTKTTVSNLNGLRFVDKVDNGSEKVEERELVSIDEKTVDRVYKNTPEKHQLSGVTGGHAIELRKTNMPDTGKVIGLNRIGAQLPNNLYAKQKFFDSVDQVVWNPWQKGLSMADLGEEYFNMICVEAGHVTDRVQLAAGCQFQATQTLTVIS